MRWCPLTYLLAGGAWAGHGGGGGDDAPRVSRLAAPRGGRGSGARGQLVGGAAPPASGRGPGPTLLRPPTPVAEDPASPPHPRRVIPTRLAGPSRADVRGGPRRTCLLWRLIVGEGGAARWAASSNQRCRPRQRDGGTHPPRRCPTEKGVVYQPASPCTAVDRGGMMPPSLHGPPYLCRIDLEVEHGAG